MRYVVSTKSGHSFVLRNVLEFEYDAEKQEADFVLTVGVIGSGKVKVENVTAIKGGGDFEPWAQSIEVVPPGTGSAGAVAVDADTGEHFFRPEPPVPVELAGLPVGPLEVAVRESVKSGDMTINTARELMH